MVWGNGAMVWGNGAIVWGNGAIVWGNGAIVWGNGAVVWGNGAMVAGDGAVVAGNGQVVAGDRAMVAGDRAEFALRRADLARRRAGLSRRGVGVAPFVGGQRLLITGVRSDVRSCCSPAVFWVLISLLILVGAGCASEGPGSRLRTPAPAIRSPYLDLAATYAIHAKSLWHDVADDSDAGGYWGDGVDPHANQNGAVRGTCNTLVGYATLVVAMDHGWLDAGTRARLEQAGLNRAGLLRYIVDDLRYVASHHVSNPNRISPVWGQSWQSALWVGTLGTASILVWNDLPTEVQAQVKQMTASEADRIAGTPPGNYLPGDTKAEENGWNLQAPAIALAVDPTSPHAASWWQAAKLYAVNTYSIGSDMTSDAKIGQDRIGRLVSTANLFPDFTLENHGFFHPDYVQVSGQELGEAWLMLRLGDALHGSTYGKRFKPYALHHVADVWKKVARPLVLPDGEFTFPAGTDWTVNCGITPSYLAFIATALDDPFARAAGEEEVKSALRRRSASPDGRILGDSNLEWWWESLLVKRSCTALLQYATSAQPARSSGELPTIDGTWLWPNAKAWVHRTSDYLVSVSWGTKRLGTFTPLGYAGYQERPYSTLPLIDGIVPKSIQGVAIHEPIGDADLLAMRLRNAEGRCIVVALPHSVLWLSPEALREIGIENDSLTRERTLTWKDGSQRVAALRAHPPIDMPGAWVNVDDQFTFVSTPDGFRYSPAGRFNRKSAAIDKLVPRSRWGAWQMLTCTKADSAAIAQVFDAKFDGQTAKITVQDGAAGKRYHIIAQLSGEVAPGADMVTIRRAQ